MFFLAHRQVVARSNHAFAPTFLRHDEPWACFFMRISLRATDDVGEGRVMLSFLATQQFQVTKVYQNSESRVELVEKISFLVKRFAYSSPLQVKKVFFIHYDTQQTTTIHFADE